MSSDEMYLTIWTQSFKEKAQSDSTKRAEYEKLAAFVSKTWQGVQFLIDFLVNKKKEAVIYVSVAILA